MEFQTGHCEGHGLEFRRVVGSRANLHSRTYFSSCGIGVCRWRRSRERSVAQERVVVVPPAHILLD
jgi:hypothetical protein